MSVVLLKSPLSAIAVREIQPGCDRIPIYSGWYTWGQENEVSTQVMAFRPRYANASTSTCQPNILPLEPKSWIDYRLLCAASRQGISLK
ncbi:MAG: hypothetical protein F6K50_12760 [Moorea sp. SIO3I7]|uniref:hypothetical protein n=1 Tax=unclassified Moorena TaxID=2683338 RepID=UPI0013BEE46D|nr:MULTISPECIES: hypothetical protein [unclassified Moorena]NEN96373.1 hypothetical protein [Moorena sp. SIO3I7]NEO07499.1 hypothetical protein [Moorena sp. SIO3I8]NEP24290.1 hypothetical protein [Moorena sp. SIO3I6]